MTGSRPRPGFAHASEAELARILDFYEVAWEYEPHTFPVAYDQAGTVLESFSPDFYLPELDLYVEITTLKQRLVRKKNRKLRRLRELYPDLRIKLLYARDFRALLLKYGRITLADALSGEVGQATPPRHGVIRAGAVDAPAAQARAATHVSARSLGSPVSPGTPQSRPGAGPRDREARRRRFWRGDGRMNGRPDLVADVAEVLITEGEIQAKVAELGDRVSADYAGTELTLVSVLKGSLPFMADLMRSITIPVQIDLMEVSSYGGSATETSGLVRILKDLSSSIDGRHVLIVEDIIDTGLTLNYLVRYLRGKNPASLRICTLLDKPARRLVEIPIDYRGFEIPDQFVIGYGLDYGERYRNLRFVGVLRPEVYAGPE